MVRECRSVRSRDRLTSARTTQTGCYCEDDVSCRPKVAPRTTPRKLISGRKNLRKNVDSFLSDETQGPKRPVAPFSPPSPTLSAETQNVIDNAEKMLLEARQQIMELSKMPPAVNIIPVEYPDGPTVDNEADDLLYIRELVTSRFNELNMGIHESNSLQQSRSQNIPRPFPKVDLSAPKFQSKTYQQFPCPFTHCHVQRPTPCEIPPVKSPTLNLDSKRVLEKTRGFSVQACPKVNIDRELSAQKMKDVHISPDPSFVETPNIGTYEYRHGSYEEAVESVRNVSFEEKRCAKVCRMDEGSSTSAIGVQVGCSSVLRESNERARVEGEDVTGMRTFERTCQVTNGEQESAASNLIKGSMENCKDESGKEETESMTKDKEGEERSELTSKEGGGEERELMAKEGKGIERPILLDEVAQMPVNEKDNFKSSEGCAKCLAKPDNGCSSERKENVQSKKNDYIQQILDDLVFIEESAGIESPLEIVPEDRKLERKVEKEHRAKINQHFCDILKKYDSRYKRDSSSSFEESLNVDSMSNSQILEYDLNEISLTKPRTKHFDAVLSIYDQTIDTITRDSKEITEKLSTWRKTYSSDSDGDDSLGNRMNFHSTKITGSEYANDMTSQARARNNNTGDGRESASKMSELHLLSQARAKQNSHVYNFNEIPNSDVSRVISSNVANAFIDYVPPIFDNTNDRNSIGNEILLKRENSPGDGESLRATPSIPLNRTSDDEKCLGVGAPRSNTNEELSISAEQCVVGSKNGKYFPTTDDLRASKASGASTLKERSDEYGNEKSSPADNSRLKGKRSPLQSKAEGEVHAGGGDNSHAIARINEVDERRLENSCSRDALRTGNVNDLISSSLETRVALTISVNENAESSRASIGTNRENNRDVERSARPIPSTTASLLSAVSKGKDRFQARSKSTSDRSVSKNEKRAHSASSHKTRDSIKVVGDKSQDGERSILPNSGRIELFSKEITRMKSSQALSAESKVFLTEILSSADSLKDCPSLRTSTSCPNRSRESLISDGNDNGIVEKSIENKTRATKSIQTDTERVPAKAKSVRINVKCAATETEPAETEGRFVQTDSQLAIGESPIAKSEDADVETSRRFLSVKHKEDNVSKSSRGSQNSSSQMETSKAISHLFPYSDYKIRDTSDTSRSEGELYVASSSSYSLGEVRFVGRNVFSGNNLIIEREDSEGLITAKSTSSTSHSKFSTESSGEIHGNDGASYDTCLMPKL